MFRAKAPKIQRSADEKNKEPENMPRVIEVGPYERFATGIRGGRRTGWWDVSFKKGARYYHCPKCSRKTRIKREHLDVWNPKESPFSEQLRSLFGEKQEQTEYYDFYCKGCGLAVRLAYWEREAGMGGPWFPFLKAVFEVDPDEV